MPIISEYQEGTRNAKVYKDASGSFCVIVNDEEDTYNSYESFHSINDAEDYAEDWVLKVAR